MGNIFILGFTDELIKVAQTRPGTRVPPKISPKHTAPGPKPFTPPKPKGPVAEGYVKGMTVSGLPKSVMRGSPKRIVSAVGERKAWEARVKKEKNKLPGWLSDSMKRPVKNHPMATPEAVARSKKEDAEAKGLVAQFTRKDKPKGRGRRFAAKDYGPSRKDLWRLAAGTPIGRTAKGGGSTGPTGIFASHRQRPDMKQKFVAQKQMRERKRYTSKSAPVPGYRAGLSQGATKPSRFFSGAGVTPSGTVVPGYKAVAKKRTI